MKLILILIIVGGLGYFFYKKNKKSAVSSSQNILPVDPSIRGDGAVDPLDRQGKQPGPDQG